MFNPTLDTRLVIEDQEFTFAPHPAVPALVWGQEGRHAVVYRMRNSHRDYALKVFRPVFRHPGLLETADALRTYREMPGMRVCDQTVLTYESHPELITQYEDLDYAMVMPWISGQTWFDYLQTRDRLTLDQSRALAESTVWVLYALEMNNLAHCDLSSGNVIVDPKQNQIHLVDVEDLYSPWLEPPPMIPAGSAGYQHIQSASHGQWGPPGDRFAGALLMAEMLSWAHPDVRRAAYGESYFAPDELQRESERLDTLRGALRIYDEQFSEAFEEAWWADSLESCPSLKTWYDLLDALPREPVSEWAPIDAKLFEEHVPTPPEIAVGRAKQAVASQQDIQRRRGCLPFLGRGCRRVLTIFSILTILVCIGGVLLLAVYPSIRQSLPPALSCGANPAAIGITFIGLVLTGKSYDVFSSF